jgi:hypothetical protein
MQFIEYYDSHQSRLFLSLAYTAPPHLQLLTYRLSSVSYVLLSAAVTALSDPALFTRKAKLVC